MTTLFFVTFLLLILVELIKGLSANGTPPILQKFAWQMDLAHFMWSNIRMFRIVLAIALVVFASQAMAVAPVAVVLGTLILGAVWAGIYWVFNHFWVGQVKFLPISQKVFLGADENKVDPQLQVVGVERDGVQKAYPVNMLFYHHQITDEIAGKPIWVTYCGLCRSGRVYDIDVDGEPLEFSLVGAISFNAVFCDSRTGSWWRQETGEAAKGPLEGRQLEDVAFEQMTLENWLAKYPESSVLQYDPAFVGKYTFLAKLLNYEASLPGWHRQETPPLVIGVETGGAVRGYDWAELQKARMVMDQVGETPLLVLSDAAGTSGFVYDRRIDGAALEFEWAEDGVRDLGTGSGWDDFGRCVSGALQGKQLVQLQSYQQFLRAWITFHPQTTFYAF
ncbi:hypothetical protein shim_23530 [Shimia sp. SK013]|uniref:DUF3179 domain-containing (seleno)protein n=1 Tax=Shimia sp. SK013 TaxID=1389006 RepID=UPI0006B5F64B|nr:DUF3179 domain-containing (seleno)protein [Shimia sp. SK013]KPA21646.1 hypothetical protein shim_23530 [Shimia sp. SK013]